MNRINNRVLMFCIAGLVSMGGILYGYDIGVISGALLFIQQAIPMTDTQMGMIVGAVLGGGLLGTLLAGPISDRYGRRVLIMLASIIFIAGVSLLLMSHTFLMILGARIFLGLGIGIISVAVPLYVAEIVPAKDRGKYMAFFQLLLTFGIVMAYIVDLAFTPSGNWRAMFAVVLIPAIILFIGMLFLPESPRWLIANQQLAAARKVLERLRASAAEVEHDIQTIQLGLQQVDGRWRELFSAPFFLPSLLAIGIAIFNQLTGINSFLQYAPLILKNAGINSSMISMLGSVGIGLLNFFCTLLAMLLIDSVGRRPLLLVGIAGLILAEVYLALLQYMEVDAATLGLLSLAGLFLFIVFFAIGPGIVVWLAIAELFPTRVRGKGMALCLFFNSLASTVLATFFLPWSHYLGMANMYWLCSSFSLFYFLIVFFFLPETKVKTLEEIQFALQKKENESSELKPVMPACS